MGMLLGTLKNDQAIRHNRPTSIDSNLFTSTTAEGPLPAAFLLPLGGRNRWCLRIAFCLGGGLVAGCSCFLFLCLNFFPSSRVFDEPSGRDTFFVRRLTGWFLVARFTPGTRPPGDFLKIPLFQNPEANPTL